ncbi:hypothetical protein BV25DRAFT_1768700, partial [Artomyces pyxidatus]
LYGMVYTHLESIWRDKFVLRPDIAMDEDESEGVAFDGRARQYTNVLVNKRRYGASTRTRGASARYGYIDVRVPVQIDYLFAICQKTPDGGSINSHVALVRRFIRDDDLPEVPWALWSTDLGVETWYADKLGPLEAVEMERLSGQFILARMDILDVSMWVTVAHDH